MPIESPRKRGTEAPSLEEIKNTLSEHITETKAQIEVIGPSLRELAKRIEKEKPDFLVFLDLSARLLATPYLRYLRETMGEAMPQIRFYNDHNLKGRYLSKDGFREEVEYDFSNVKGRKIFFVDETFSHGAGASALFAAAELLDLDAHYFALSKDPEPSPEFELDEKAGQLITENINSGRIVIYPNAIKNLFSRFGSRLYTQDFQGETLPLQTSQNKQDKGGIPDANSYIRPPEGMTTEEYSSSVAALFHSAVIEMKEMIFQSLVSKADS